MLATTTRTTERMKDDLSPCPFCKAEAEIETMKLPKYNGKIQRTYQVGCSNLKCVIYPKTDFLFSKEKAIKEWNKCKKDLTRKCLE